jgi:hypothetical protein
MGLSITDDSLQGKDSTMWIAIVCILFVALTLTFLLCNARRRRRISRWICPEDPKPLTDLYQRAPQNSPTQSRVLDDLHQVRNWTLEVQNDAAYCLGAEIGEERIEKWTQIATEVRLRKSLILAAAKDLGQAMDDIRKFDHNFDLRNFEIGYVSKGPDTAAAAKTGATPSASSASNVSPAWHDPALDSVKPNVLVMAATDVFAEKAQKTLSDRAKLLIALGTIVGLIALACLIAGALWVGNRTVFELFEAGILDMTKHPNQFMGLIILQRITVSGLLLGAVYFLVMVSRALLHEAMVLLGRRHSLRFGRLYVYSKLGHINYEEMEKAFAWSSEHHSAFADIRGEKITKSLVQTIAGVAREVAKSTATAVSDVAKAKKGVD